MTVSLSAVHLVDEGSFLVSNPRRFTLEVEGMTLSHGTFVVSDVSNILYVRTIPVKKTHYVNSEGEIKTVEEYESEVNRLSENAEKDGYGNPEFEDLDDEYSYRKFIKEWNPIYSEPEVEKSRVSVDVVEVRVESGDPDIKSLWNSPGVARKSHLYSLHRNPLAVRTFKSLCLELGLNYHVPEHSGVRYAKVDGSYIFKENMDFKDFPFIGTLEQCVEEKNRIKNEVRTAVEIPLAKKRGVSLKNASQVLCDLETILSSVSEIRPMKASRSQYMVSLKRLRELIESVKGSLLSDVKGTPQD
jgi:hypothetical protein